MSDTHDTLQTHEENRLTYVGIGASAGGLEALRLLVAAPPLNIESATRWLKFRSQPIATATEPLPFVV